MAFTYDMEVKFSPDNPIKRGTRVDCEVRLVNIAGGEVAFVVAELPAYGMRHRLPMQGNVFSTSIDVPMIAPRGSYDVHAYAVSTDRKKGPTKKMRIQIV